MQQPCRSRSPRTDCPKSGCIKKLFMCRRPRPCVGVGTAPGARRSIRLPGGIPAGGGNDAARYLNGALALNSSRIKTVPDLVRFMVENDLTFAPAVNGDEAVYAALRRALAA